MNELWLISATCGTTFPYIRWANKLAASEYCCWLWRFSSIFPAWIGNFEFVCVVVIFVRLKCCRVRIFTVSNGWNFIIVWDNSSGIANFIVCKKKMKKRTFVFILYGTSTLYNSFSNVDIRISLQAYHPDN